MKIPRILFLEFGIGFMILGSFLAYSQKTFFLYMWAMINGFVSLWVYDYYSQKSHNRLVYKGLTHKN